MNIAAFQTEFARRGQMTVFERINEDAAKAKAAKAEAFRLAGAWWMNAALWDYATVDVLTRPTEIMAFHALLWSGDRDAGMAKWMRTLKAGWPEARAAVLVRQAYRDAERREQVRRKRLRRPMGALALAL